MLERELTEKQLRSYFSWIDSYICNSSKDGLTDANIFCENLCMELLNKVYNYELINMNDVQKNFPAIDLGDLNSSIAFQVTSNNSLEKIKTTVEKFLYHKLQEKYKKLKIIIIGRKNKHKEEENNFGNAEFSFIVKEDLMDLYDVLRDIMELENEKINYMFEFLKKEIRIPNKIGYSYFQKEGESMNYELLENVNYQTIPFIDIVKSFEINEYDSYSSEHRMLKFYGETFDFSSDDNGFIFKLPIQNLGSVPINKLKIYNLNISYNVGEVDLQEFTVTPICSYSEEKEINNIVNPNNIIYTNIIFSEILSEFGDDEIYNELYIDFSIGVWSCFSRLENKYNFTLFCTKVEGDSEDMENICGNYIIDSVKAEHIISLDHV